MKFITSFVQHGLLAATLAAFTTLTGTAHAAATLGDNLIVNGDAEADVTGWIAFDGYSLFQAVDYGSNWVLPTQPGPVDRGARMFAGMGGQSAGYQLVDLGDIAAQPLSYSLSGWLGGWLEQNDNALLYVSFLDEGSQEIGHAAIGPVMPADRGNATGLFLQHSEGLLPTGTRSLMFSLSMERLSGGDNDGYADNLSFVLQAAPVPEASSALLTLAGLLTCAAWGSRPRSSRTGWAPGPFHR